CMDWIPAVFLIFLVSELGNLRLAGPAWGIGKALAFLGKYSFEMYLIHSIFIKFFGGYTFYTMESVYIVIRILAASAASAVVFCFFRKWSGIDRLLDKLRMAVDGGYSKA
ncbi:MAG: hypothetical protein IKN57_12860, partial [Parasporobacterium sp.]|nr:hypothetical protein [Parasporobacterium sp.]